MCACNGVAVFGRKFLSGKPGAGTKALIKQLRQMDHMEIRVSHLIHARTRALRKVDYVPDMMAAPAAASASRRTASPLVQK